jgi:hypothetical protein
MRGRDMKRDRKQKEMSIYEASDYWDAHEFKVSEDIHEVSDIRFALKKKKYVGVEVRIFAKIKERARRLHTTEDTLVNEWLREKVG